MIAAVVVVAAALVGTGRAFSENEGSFGSSCKLTLQTDLAPMKEPLVLAVKNAEIRGKGKPKDVKVKSPDFAVVEVDDGKGVVEVESGEQLLLACPGKRNYNPVTKRQTAYATCQDGNLTIKDRPVTVNTISCTHNYAESSLRKTQTTCGHGDNTGKILEAGFQLDGGPYLLVYKTCFNPSNSRTLYSVNIIDGHSLKGRVKSTRRPFFSKGPKGLFSKVNPDYVYTKKAQVKAFKELIKNSSWNITDKNFLARGHLAPNADFVFNTQRLATFEYINVAPQWQPFNGGNWVKIETTVRDYAVKVDGDINVYTGTYGILKLQDDNGREHEMYLDPKKKLIAVPEVFWKIVQDPVTGACIVAVGHNNIFLTVAPTPICTTSTPNGWPKLDNLEQGYTYYCNYDSFVETVTYAPKLECKGMLEFP